MTFNGVTKPWLIIRDGRQKSPFPPINNNLLSVQGMPGAYLESTEVDVLYITQPIGFIAEDDDDAQAKTDELSGWLLTSEPVPLQFSDEPGRTYYAKIDGDMSDFNKFARLRRGTITFVCPNPFAHGPEKSYTFSSDEEAIENEGTAEAEPIFEMEVTQSVTFAMIQNHLNEYMMIGQPVDVESIEFQEKELILQDTMDSLTGWTEGTQLDNGTPSGSMTVDNSRLVVGDWGTEAGTAKWYGPAIKKSLSEQLQDFRAEMRIENIDDASEVGKVEMYFLDVNDQIIGRITLKDAWQGYQRNRGEARAGNASNGHYLLDESYAGAWHDFIGILRLERRGNEWTSYICKVRENGEHHARETRHFSDDEYLYMDQLAQIQIAITKFGDYEPTQAAVRDLKVWKLNDPSDFEIPYIANQGDRITFDHTNNGEVRINGEPFENIIMGSSFFSLKPKTNQLVVQPNNSFNTSLKYRPPYK